MKKLTPTLSDEIKKNILSRIVLCVCILAIAHIITIGFYMYLFAAQTKHHLEELSKDLTPYIISQEIIEDRYAISLKLDELSKQNDVTIQWFKQAGGKNSGLEFSGLLRWKYLVPVRAVDNKYYGYYVISGSLLSNQWMMIGLFIQFLFLIIFIMLICFILYPVAYSIPKKIIINPINMLVKLLHKNDQIELDSFTASHEIVLLRDHFINILSKQNEILKKTEILKLSTQVAHDIRSPLAAINVAISDVSSIPENKRVMIRNASQRINDIANNLLLQARGGAVGIDSKDKESNTFSELIFVVLDNIITEKRYEYNKKKINIQLNVSEFAYDSFSDINLGAFKRILSNLINNSIEAINSDGNVIVSLCSIKNIVEINIQDDGCGIPQELLQGVMEHGVSFKKNGAGLGLAHAKQQIEKMKGEISLHSTLNVGTNVTIRLPKSACPVWFCKCINISSDYKVVVLDDDPSIHDAWRERLDHISGINLTHFYKASDLTSVFMLYPAADLYLVDYELLNDNATGLDIIEKLNLCECAVLVTSCFEDKILRNRCEKLAVKIIPKSFVPYVPILSSNKVQAGDLVFIDNDDLMRKVWLLAAEDVGLNISTYLSPDEFNKDINRYSKDSPIYIDSDLGGDIKGEQYAKYLYDCGFRELYLATGYQPKQFGHLPWIKSIVSKEPPFLLKG